MSDSDKKRSKKRAKKRSKKKGVEERSKKPEERPVQKRAHEEDHAHPSLGVYFAVFVALLCLTAATVAAAYVDMGPWSAPVAVAIATLKGSLVILFFMHLRYESRLIALYAASGFGMLLILFVFTLGEMKDRPPQPEDDPLTPSGALEPGPPDP